MRWMAGMPRTFVERVLEPGVGAVELGKAARCPARSCCKGDQAFEVHVSLR